MVGTFAGIGRRKNHEKPYYEGIYEVYYGQATMNKGASMTKYGLTMAELKIANQTNCNAMSNTQWTFQEKTA